MWFCRPNSETLSADVRCSRERTGPFVGAIRAEPERDEGTSQQPKGMGMSITAVDGHEDETGHEQPSFPTGRATGNRPRDDPGHHDLLYPDGTRTRPSTYEGRATPIIAVRTRAHGLTRSRESAGDGRIGGADRPRNLGLDPPSRSSASVAARS